MEASHGWCLPPPLCRPDVPHPQGPDTSSGAQTARTMCPGATTLQPPRRGSPLGAALERSPHSGGGEVSAPGAEGPQAQRAVPLLAATSGALSLACGPQPLTCPPRRLRPCSERSSRSLQRAPGTQCGSERLPAPARRGPASCRPLAARVGRALLIGGPFPSPDTGGAQAPRRSHRSLLQTGKSEPRPRPGSAPPAPDSESPAPRFFLLRLFNLGARCALQQKIPVLQQTLPTLFSTVAFNLSPHQLSEDTSR